MCPMKHDFIELLCCPSCRGEMALTVTKEAFGEVEEGHFDCQSCRATYRIVRFIPRFVPAENYASSFGFQWNKFRRTQLDSHTGLPLSRERFYFSSGWSPQE